MYLKMLMINLLFIMLLELEKVTILQDVILLYQNL